MRTNLLVAVIVFCVAVLWAADNITPLNVKEGLWEMTVTHSMTGMPGMPNIPPDTLAKNASGPARPGRSHDEWAAEHRHSQGMHHQGEA